MASPLTTLVCDQCSSRVSPREAGTRQASANSDGARCAYCGTPQPQANDAAMDPPVPRHVTDVQVDDATAVVHLTGTLDVAAAAELRTALHDACESGRHVLIEMSDVDMIDSTTLGALVRAHQHAKRQQRMLCLVAPNRFVVTVLHTMRLLSIFPISDTVPVAVRWLSEVDTRQ